MIEVQIIDIYNQGISEVIGFVKELSNQIKIVIVVNHHRQMALKGKPRV